MEKQVSRENPLLANSGLPRYDQIKVEDVIPAVRKVLQEADSGLAQLET